MIVLAPILLFGIAAAAMAPPAAHAAGATLAIVVDETTRSFDRDALLARPDAADISVPRDIAYGAGMTYRAVPLAALLNVPASADRVLEVEAEDGFVAQLPLELVNNRDPREAVAYVAIETADKPWLPVPTKERSAGPFYIVWLGDRAGSVPALEWPYQVLRLTVQDAPTKRWPALAVDAKLPALDPARAGQNLFATTCFTCHSLNRAGLAAVGPDLNLPMNPTEYLTDAGLRALIRDPRAVRAWPEQRMPGFTEEQLSDQEIGLIVDYLKHMAGRKIPSAEGKGRPP
jgi:mono/diheme cytochrome c family protein